MAKGYVQRMLAEGEKILVITRQHWFVVASAVFFESCDDPHLADCSHRGRVCGKECSRLLLS